MMYAERFFCENNIYERGGFMYPVSESFITAVQKNTRKYYRTGRITRKAWAVYEFSNEDIVKGSGYISSQCCGSSEIESFNRRASLEKRMLQLVSNNAEKLRVFSLIDSNKHLGWVPGDS